MAGWGNHAVLAASLADPSGTFARWVVLLVGLLAVGYGVMRLIRAMSEVVVLVRDVKAMLVDAPNLKKATEENKVATVHNTEALNHLSERLERAGI